MATHVLRQNSLLGFMLLVLLAAALCVFVGTALGLANFTDVGYPDSATLLRINDRSSLGSNLPGLQSSSLSGHHLWTIELCPAFRALPPSVSHGHRS